MKSISFKSGVLKAAIAIFLVAGLGPTAVAAHADIGKPPLPHPKYVITELETVGGSSGAGSSINNQGWVTGTSNVAGDQYSHATLWRNGAATDLGTLGGPNSAVLWPQKNEHGLVVGIAETDQNDPRDELWSCFYFFPSDSTGRACRGFVWERNSMRALPTFGGTHGFAAGLNNRGQVVGWAELAAEDPTCNAPQALGFHAALWDTRRGDLIQDLAPLPGDRASAATAVNDDGHVVGISGDCADAVGGFSARHAVMWRDGHVREIGDFGGEAWNTPMAINGSGVVVGFANAAGTPGATFDERAFVWAEQSGIRALRSLRGHTRAQALGVNDLGQIVGMSRATGQRGHAVVWSHGRVVDLNQVAPGYAGHMLSANDVNDDGIITGQAVTASGRTVAFVATPVEDR